LAKLTKTQNMLYCKGGKTGKHAGYLQRRRALRRGYKITAKYINKIQQNTSIKLDKTPQ